MTDAERTLLFEIADYLLKEDAVSCEAAGLAKGSISPAAQRLLDALRSARGSP